MIWTFIVYGMHHLNEKTWSKERWIISTAASCYHCIMSYRCVRERKRRSELGICQSASRLVSSRPKPTNLTSPRVVCPRTIIFPCCSCSSSGTLKPSTVLLVNMPVALLLHAVFEDHGDAQNQDEVNTDDSKGCREDLVKILVGE